MKIHTTAHYGRVEAIKVLRDKMGYDIKDAKRIMEILSDAKDGYALDRVAEHMDEYRYTTLDSRHRPRHEIRYFVRLARFAHSPLARTPCGLEASFLCSCWG